jgi:hypothetical protein
MPLGHVYKPREEAWRAAAASAAKSKASPRDVDVCRLRQDLAAAGAILAPRPDPIKDDA